MSKETNSQSKDVGLRTTEDKGSEMEIELLQDQRVRSVTKNGDYPEGVTPSNGSR